MRKSMVVVVGFILMSVLMMSSGAVTARHVVHIEVTIQPGSTYTDARQLSKGEIQSEAWTSESVVRFLVKDPDSETIRQSNGTSGQVMVEAEDSGNFTFSWTNIGSQPTTLVSDSVITPPERSTTLLVAVLAAIIALIALMIAVLAVMMRRTPK